MRVSDRRAIRDFDREHDALISVSQPPPRNIISPYRRLLDDCQKLLPLARIFALFILIKIPRDASPPQPQPRSSPARIISWKFFYFVALVRHPVVSRLVLFRDGEFKRKAKKFSCTHALESMTSTNLTFPSIPGLDLLETSLVFCTTSLHPIGLMTTRSFHPRGPHLRHYPAPDLNLTVPILSLL